MKQQTKSALHEARLEIVYQVISDAIGIRLDKLYEILKKLGFLKIQADKLIDELSEMGKVKVDKAGLEIWIVIPLKDNE